MMLNSSLGFVMFFIRSCETNFYSVLDCNCIIKNYNENESNEEKKVQLKKNETLISMISSNMNLEFMCCILYGLTEIFYKKKARKHKMPITTNEDNPMDRVEAFSNKGGFDCKIKEEIKNEKENGLRENIINHIIKNDLSENFLFENSPVKEGNDSDTMKGISRKKTAYINTKKLNFFKSDEIKTSSNHILANTFKTKSPPFIYRNKTINYKNYSLL